MKIELPFAARYAWPLLVGALCIDLIVIVGAVLALHTMRHRAHSFETSGMKCVSYAPSHGDTLYMVARCVTGGQK